MSANPPDLLSLRRLWLSTPLWIRAGGRTLDIDTVSSSQLSKAVAPGKLPIFIITAHNPDAKLLAAAKNQARNRELRGLLDQRRLAWHVAIGRARDGSWAEAGFAISGLPAGAASSLGREFGQLAVFEITRDQITVVAADGAFRDSRPRGDPRQQGEEPV